MMSNFIARLEKLEKRRPDADDVINLILRRLISPNEEEREISYLKGRDSESVYVRESQEDEDRFIDRASKEYRAKINAGEKDIIWFLGSYKMEDDWSTNNENEKDE